SETVDALLAFTFVGAFCGSVAIYMLYFGRTAEQGVQAIVNSDDPGKLAAFAYHYVHPLMVAGIILAAAGDEVVLHDPSHHAVDGAAWFVAGGGALFLLGHFVYLRLIRTAWPIPHLAAIAVLLGLAVVGSHLAGLTVGLLTLAILTVLLIADAAVKRGRVSI
ncbi:MAG: low temperature requirement protein A, partial [Allobranchiibius sp.]